MIPAKTSKRFGGATRLLTLKNQDQIEHATVQQLVDDFNPGDLLIVNRSATLPSSFRGRVEKSGDFVEIRLAAFQGPNPDQLDRWLAFSFGKGDWRVPTEKRDPPPRLSEGDRIIFGDDLSLIVARADYGRLLEVQFESSDLKKNLYRHGRPIQYSYLEEPLEVWDQQTIFSGPPISVEAPSASFPFTWEIIFALEKKGVKIAGLLHGAGISSTGSSALDQLLPLQEWYDIPLQTALAVEKAKRDGRKIVALGTTVIRALESAWTEGGLKAGSGLTSLKITSSHKIRTADALITGMHEDGTSHMNILDCFCSPDRIRSAYVEAAKRNYRGHEYGDLTYWGCKSS